MLLRYSNTMMWIQLKIIRLGSSDWLGQIVHFIVYFCKTMEQPEEPLKEEHNEENTTLITKASQ